MSSQTIDRIQHLFVVRIWQEPSASAPPGQWRGSVEHVSSGQRYYFARIVDLNTFVLGQMNKAALGSFVGSGEDEMIDSTSG